MPAEVRKLELGDMLWVVRSRSDPDIGVYCELCVLHSHASHSHAIRHCLAEFVMNHLVERKNVSASLSLVPLSFM